MGGAWGGELVDEGGVLKRVEETTGALGDGERGGEEMERGGELGMDDLIMREVMLEEGRRGVGGKEKERMGVRVEMGESTSHCG